MLRLSSAGGHLCGPGPHLGLFDELVQLSQQLCDLRVGRHVPACSGSHTQQVPSPSVSNLEGPGVRVPSLRASAHLKGEEERTAPGGACAVSGPEELSFARISLFANTQPLIFTLWDTTSTRVVAYMTRQLVTSLTGWFPPCL